MSGGRILRGQDSGLGIEVMSPVLARAGPFGVGTRLAGAAVLGLLCIVWKVWRVD